MFPTVEWVVVGLQPSPKTLSLMATIYSFSISALIGVALARQASPATIFAVCATCFVTLCAYLPILLVLGVDGLLLPGSEISSELRSKLSRVGGQMQNILVNARYNETIHGLVTALSAIVGVGSTLAWVAGALAAPTAITLVGFALVGYAAYIDPVVRGITDLLELLEQEPKPRVAHPNLSAPKVLWSHRTRNPGLDFREVECRVPAYRLEDDDGAGRTPVAVWDEGLGANQIKYLNSGPQFNQNATLEAYSTSSGDIVACKELIRVAQAKMVAMQHTFAESVLQVPSDRFIAGAEGQIIKYGLVNIGDGEIKRVRSGDVLSTEYLPARNERYGDLDLQLTGAQVLTLQQQVAAIRHQAQAQPQALPAALGPAPALGALQQAPAMVQAVAVPLNQAPEDDDEKEPLDEAGEEICYKLSWPRLVRNSCVVAYSYFLADRVEVDADTLPSSHLVRKIQAIRAKKRVFFRRARVSPVQAGLLILALVLSATSPVKAQGYGYHEVVHGDPDGPSGVRSDPKGSKAMPPQSDQNKVSVASAHQTVWQGEVDPNGNVAKISSHDGPPEKRTPPEAVSTGLMGGTPAPIMPARTLDNKVASIIYRSNSDQPTPHKPEDFGLPPNASRDEVLVAALDNVRLFVKAMLVENFIPINESMSFDEWLEQSHYSAARKQQIRDAPMYARSAQNTVFQKVETYSAYKPPRMIFNASQLYKNEEGPVVASVSESLRVFADFLKGVAVRETLDTVHELFSDLGEYKVYLTDHTSFECTFDAPVKDAFENLLFEWVGQNDPQLMEHFKKVQNGTRLYTNGALRFACKAKRASGDQRTSLANTFTNWAMIQYVNKVYKLEARCVVNGDDGLIAVPPHKEIKSEWFARLGANVKISETTLEKSGFCGLQAIKTPRGQGRYSDAFVSVPKLLADSRPLRAAKAKSLLAGKCISYIVDYVGDPVLSGLCVPIVSGFGSSPRLNDSYYERQVARKIGLEYSQRGGWLILERNFLSDKPEHISWFFDMDPGMVDAQAELMGCLPHDVRRLHWAAALAGLTKDARPLTRLLLSIPSEKDSARWLRDYNLSYLLTDGMYVTGRIDYCADLVRAMPDDFIHRKADCVEMALVQAILRRMADSKEPRLFRRGARALVDAVSLAVAHPVDTVVDASAPVVQAAGNAVEHTRRFFGWVQDVIEEIAL